jgi:dienelactone hydrolase
MEPLGYDDGGVALEGLIARPKTGVGKRPGVVVFPEVTGLADHPRRRLGMLAELGYVALAADMYGKGVAPGPQNRDRMNALKDDRLTLRSRARAAFDALAAQPDVDPTKIAAIGYCFGGGCVLELARAGAPAAGFVSFHGLLDTTLPATPGAVKGPIVCFAGVRDPLVPIAQVDAFEKEMEAAGADWRIMTYGGAGHSFTNVDVKPGERPGFEYEAKADHRSWRGLLGFFGEIFPAEARPK